MTDSLKGSFNGYLINTECLRFRMRNQRTELFITGLLLAGWQLELKWFVCEMGK